MCPKDVNGMAKANDADPDETAPVYAVCPDLSATVFRLITVLILFKTGYMYYCGSNQEIAFVLRHYIFAVSQN